MSPKCPNCGWSPPRGRPVEIDVAKAKMLRKGGHTYRSIAQKLGVTEGAVRAALKRSK